MAQTFPHSRDFAAAHMALSNAQIALADARRAESNAYAKLGELFEAQGRAYLHAATVARTCAERKINERGAAYSFGRQRYYEDMAAQK